MCLYMKLLDIRFSMVVYEWGQQELSKENSGSEREVAKDVETRGNLAWKFV